MKKLQLLFILLPFIGFSQKVHDKVIKSSIDEVKLYLTAGEMIHKQKITLEKGRNRLIFSGVSAYADPQSIQFTSNGNYRLVSVTTEMDFLAAEEFNPRISTLKDSLEFLKDEQQEVIDMLDAYYSEQAVLKTNRDLGGNSQNLTVEQIRAAGEFYRTRTLEINKAITKLKKEKRTLATSIEDTRFQLVELNYDENQRSNQVIILLDSQSDQSIDGTLKYLVSECGWAATYDLSAADLQHKINLKYKAQIYNNTGNDWVDVKLMLSTGDPHISASHPVLSPWYLNNYGNIATTGSIGYANSEKLNQEYQQSAISNINEANKRAYDNYYIEGDERLMDNTFQLNSMTLIKEQNVGTRSATIGQIEISELTAEFDIENTFSCPSDARPYMVDVKEMDLDATFSHVSIPKLDKSAFLLAHITGWQELELIPGPTHVYFGGVYVGKSAIDVRNVSDTLSLSFGRDDKVLVMRKLKKEMSTKRVTGNTKKESYLYEIAVRNNRAIPIRIDIYDQIPLSRSNDISVFVDEISEGLKDDLTGEVAWNLNIGASGVAGKEIGYTVKYPKNANVSLRRTKYAAAYMF